MENLGGVQLKEPHCIKYDKKGCLTLSSPPTWADVGDVDSPGEEVEEQDDAPAEEVEEESDVGHTVEEAVPAEAGGRGDALADTEKAAANAAEDANDEVHSKADAGLEGDKDAGDSFKDLLEEDHKVLQHDLDGQEERDENAEKEDDLAVALAYAYYLEHIEQRYWRQLKMTSPTW